MNALIMESLNLNHLHYFWTVATEGTIARAADKLHLTSPTISTQLGQLERSLGQKLFKRSGRVLELTDTGRVVFRYADDMFSISRELLGRVSGGSAGGPVNLSVGVVNALPKMVTHHLLQPALRLTERVNLFVRHDSFDVLLRDLAIHEIDVVISDSPVTPSMKIRAFNHLLGESALSILGSRKLATTYRPNFPLSLKGAPFLLPSRANSVRREIDRWLDSQDIRPEIRCEIDDTALLKVFGQAGEGLFAVPMVVEQDVCRQYAVEMIGRIDGVKEQYYAISGERRLKHPAVIAISTAAREDFFRSLNND